MANIPAKFQQTDLAVKKQNMFIVFLYKMFNLPPMKALGNFFYSIGFAGELIFVKIWRIARDAGIFIAQLIAWIFISIGKGILNALKYLWRDLKAPFVNIGANFKGHKPEKVTVTNSGEKAIALKQPQQPATAGRKVKNTAFVIANIIRYLLPLVAVIALVFTVDSLLGYRYALAVEMDGQIIGYVSDDIALEEAVRIVQGRIKASDGKTGEDWHPEGIKLSLASVSSLTNKSQLINNMLEMYMMSSERNDALIPASGLMIDGELYAVTTEGEAVKEYLDSLLEEHSEQGAQVYFAKSVEMEIEEDQYYFASSVSEYNDLINDLEKIEKPAEYYVTSEGETIAEISRTHGVSIENLLAYNPDIEYYTDEDSNDENEEEEIDSESQPIQYVMPETELVIQKEVPFLQIKKVIEVSYEEVVPYEIIEMETDKKVKGWRGKSQDGEDGLNRVYDNKVYVDGELVETIRLNEKTTVIKEAVPEIFEIGIYEFGSGGKEASTTFMWPAPQYRTVSRGYGASRGSHKALDITGNAGIPILASRSGEVIASGNVSHWSYGILVIIKHDNTYETLYAHLISTNVSEGDIVEAGDVIGFMGSTGRSTGNHLHFEIIENGVLIDPYNYVTRP